MKITAYCTQCDHKHGIEHNPLVPTSDVSDWYCKHLGHTGVGFDWDDRSPKKSTVPFRGQYHPTEARTLPKRLAKIGKCKDWPDERFVEDRGPHIRFPIAPIRLFEMLDNANIKLAYAASANPTFTLASLAASTTLLAGRESGSTSNTSNLYLDYLVGGNYRAAATNNQAGSIYTCVVGAFNDTPTWPDVFDGTDSVETVSKQGVFNSICKFLSTIGADATASQDWPFSGASVAGCFGGELPTTWVYFVTHSIQTSTNVWNASGNTFSHTGIYCTAI